MSFGWIMVKSIVIILIISMSDRQLPTIRQTPLSRPKGLNSMLGHHRQRQLLINKKYEWASGSVMLNEQHAIQRFVNMSLNPKKTVLKAVTAPTNPPFEERDSDNPWQYRKVLIINHKPTHCMSGCLPVKRKDKNGPEEVKKHHRSNMSIRRSFLHQQHPLKSHNRSLRDLTEPRNRSCNVTVAKSKKKREDFDLKSWRYNDESDKQNEEMME